MRRLLVLAILAVLAAGCTPAQDRQVVCERPLAGGTDVTFFVTGDTHFGAWDVATPPNRLLVEQMNALPGTPYPPDVGGTVDTPRGVLHVGDITDYGMLWQWIEFEQMYGLTGTEGLLKFPVFECTGNHDRFFPFNATIPLAVARRHGDVLYSWDWGDVHLVCLDDYPTLERSRWLAQDLASVGHQAPVVIFFHHTLTGALAEDWSEMEHAAFVKAIAGYNVVAIFNGHWHMAGHDVWHGVDVFRPGSPKHSDHEFLVVHITDTRLVAAFYNWDLPDSRPPGERWTRPVFVKPINGAK